MELLGSEVGGLWAKNKAGVFNVKETAVHDSIETLGGIMGRTITEEFLNQTGDMP